MDITQRKRQFIEKAKLVHKGENLDYSKVVYVNNRTPVIIVDNDLDECGVPYGEYLQTPSNHLKGQSHPRKKGFKVSKSKSFTTEQVVKMFKMVHQGEDLDYSEVRYVNMHTPVKIICNTLDANGNKYGAFLQEPAVHLKGCTHPRLSIDRNSEKSRYTTQIFVDKCISLYGTEHYDYKDVEYVNSKTKVNVFCNYLFNNGQKHGFFSVSPDLFLQGKGCPICGRQTSNHEKELLKYVSSIVGEDNVVANDTSLLGGQELDIYIPTMKTAIEYNGLRWHSDEFKPDRYYHVNKTNKCKEAGVRLVQIYEDEYLEHKEIVLNKLRHLLLKDNTLSVVGGRKCNIRKINKKTARQFLDKNHIQGYASSTVYYGAYHGKRLIAVMSFNITRRGCDVWELNRFASVSDLKCPGVASKLFKRFLNDYNPSLVKSFLDRRWNQEGNTVYERLGFVVDEILKPDYDYTKASKRLHKFNFRKTTLHRKYGLPLSMTEHQMAIQLGYNRIWDCGLVRYVWKRKGES